MALTSLGMARAFVGLSAESRNPTTTIASRQIDFTNYTCPPASYNQLNMPLDNYLHMAAQPYRLMDASNNGGDDEGCETQENPFMMLLRHLNPLIDQLLIQPEFHRFLDLPLELRYNVYEQYFLDNMKSNCTAHWPALHVAKLFGSRRMGETYRPSILPNLCMVNKVLRQELMACLLDPMGINFQDAAALASFDGVCLAPEFNPFHLVARVRNATFPDVNANAYRILLEENPTKAAEMIQRTKRLNTTFSRLLPSYSGLRYLNIALYSPGV
jgi:hypothetical protein